MRYLSRNTDNSRNLWSPLSLFDEYWPTSYTGWQPSYDVQEEEDHFLLSLELPGIAKDQVKIEAIDNQLTITGERHRRGERTSFHRSFSLPRGVDVSQVEAQYQDGILQLYIPKAASAKPRQIQIGTQEGKGFFGKEKANESTAVKDDRAA